MIGPADDACFLALPPIPLKIRIGNDYALGSFDKRKIYVNTVFVHFFDTLPVYLALVVGYINSMDGVSPRNWDTKVLIKMVMRLTANVSHPSP